MIIAGEAEQRMRPIRYLAADSRRYTRFNGIQSNTRSSLLFLDNQHCVAVGIKAVSLLDGVIVSGEDVIEARKGGDQRQEGGFWQMEVCYRSICNFEFIAGLYE